MYKKAVFLKMFDSDIPLMFTLSIVTTVQSNLVVLFLVVLILMRVKYFVLLYSVQVKDSRLDTECSSSNRVSPA